MKSQKQSRHVRSQKMSCHVTSLCDDTDDSCLDNSMVEGNDGLSDVSFNDQFL